MPSKKLEEADAVEDVNQAADAEFNGDEQKPGVGNIVGGLRGSSD